MAPSPAPPPNVSQKAKDAARKALDRQNEEVRERLNAEKRAKYAADQAVRNIARAALTAKRDAEKAVRDAEKCVPSSHCSLKLALS